MEISDETLAELNERFSKSLERIEKKMDLNNTMTQDGFNKINGRVKKLELKEAHRQGAEDAVGKTKSAKNIVEGQGWVKITLALTGIIVSALALLGLALRFIIGGGSA